MSISIVTPSFRNSDWLKLCIASVADQGVNAEHIVQDAGSDDGTLDWLPKDPRVKAYVERDSGMYDAVNRGLRRSSGNVLAYLNCDEQYLPGALKSVEEFFRSNTNVDVLFGYFVVVDAKGDYLFHRRVQTPLLYHTWTSHLSTFTCATFFRRRVIDEHGIYFDPRLRDVGDGDWMVRLLKKRLRLAVLPIFTSAFTMTGANMSTRPNALKENAALRASAPPWVRRLKLVWIAHHRLRRLLGGIYSQPPFSYSIYTLESPMKREDRQVVRPTTRWRTG